MNELVDLKGVLGSPYISVTEAVYGESGSYTTSKQVVNIEFVTNFVFCMFFMILLGNILLRLFWGKRR